MIVAGTQLIDVVSVHIIKRGWRHLEKIRPRTKYSKWNFRKIEIVAWGMVD